VTSPVMADELALRRQLRDAARADDGRPDGRPATPSDNEPYGDSTRGFAPKDGQNEGHNMDTEDRETVIPLPASGPQGRAAADATTAAPGLSDLEIYIRDQRVWSKSIFGPGRRTKGICQHIRTEMQEIAADPKDWREWIDIVILALDGAWRHGGSPREIAIHLYEKQQINFARHWPPRRSQAEDEATEHIHPVPAHRGAAKPPLPPGGRPQPPPCGGLREARAHICMLIDEGRTDPTRTLLSIAEIEQIYGWSCDALTPADDPGHTNV